MGRNGFRPQYIIIGAMDGVSFDETRGYINMYGWSGLFVEPIPEMFSRLIKSYENAPFRLDNRYENSAITEENKPIEMIRIPPSVVDGGAVHSCFNGMSAIYPPRNGLGSEGDRATVEKYAERLYVNGITMETLLSRHNIKHFDFISIDAEGWDWKILKQLDLRFVRPKLIRCEYINLTPEEQKEMTDFFIVSGYQYIIVGQNIDAVERGWWRIVADSTRA